MEYELGIKLDKILEAQVELGGSLYFILRVLEKGLPEKYKQALNEIRKEQLTKQ